MILQKTENKIENEERILKNSYQSNQTTNSGVRFILPVYQDENEDVDEDEDEDEDYDEDENDGITTFCSIPKPLLQWKTCSII